MIFSYANQYKKTYTDFERLNRYILYMLLKNPIIKIDNSGARLKKKERLFFDLIIPGIFGGSDHS